MSFYQECEKIGDLKFTEWANKVGIFKEMNRLDLYSRVDWICKSKTNKIVNCELKVRLSLDWDTIFIEPGKWNYLIDKWNKEKIIPWYINICGDLVYVFDLRYINPSIKQNVRIWDKGALSFKYEDRYELNTNKAYKFKNGIQIQKKS